MYGRNDYWNYGQSHLGYCYNDGKVSGKSFVGGISGSNNTNCDIYHSVNAGKVEGTSNVGEIYGSSSGYSSNNKSYSDITLVPSIISIIQGDNVFIEDTEGINNGYPIFAWQVEKAE